MSVQEFEVIFLGTGTSQGIPVIGCTCDVCRSEDSRDKRLRTSATVEIAGTRIVFDVGPDFRQQLLANDISDIEAILLTHEHNDHVSGVDDIRPINFLQRKDISIWASMHVQGELRKRFPYVFDEDSKYPGKPRVHLRTVDNDLFSIGPMDITPIHVTHGGLPVLGFRIGRFVYITDAKEIPESEMHKLTGVHTLVLNALHRRRHFSHLNLEEALELIGRIGPERAYLTHLSHNMGKHADVEAELPSNVNLGYDGLRLQVPVE